MTRVAIHGSFDISDYQEQIESVSGNIKTLQDTLDKLNNNEFDFANDNVKNGIKVMYNRLLATKFDTSNL